jgi:hypothetical protein
MSNSSEAPTPQGAKPRSRRKPWIIVLSVTVFVVGLLFCVMSYQRYKHAAALRFLQGRGAELYQRQMVQPPLASALGLGHWFETPGYKRVLLWGKEFGPQELRAATNLQGVWTLGLIDTSLNCDDLANISALGPLGVLNVGGANIDDSCAREIARLEGVGFLGVADTSISKEQLAKLRDEFRARAGFAESTLPEVRYDYDLLFGDRHKARRDGPIDVQSMERGR